MSWSSLWQADAKGGSGIQSKIGAPVLACVPLILAQKTFQNAKRPPYHDACTHYTAPFILKTMPLCAVP